MTVRELVETAVNSGERIPRASLPIEWLISNNPAEFESCLKHNGFEVVLCKKLSGEYSCLYAVTKEGYIVLWNGRCWRTERNN